jgi:hypothetical protein
VSAQKSARRPATPSFVPYCTLRSPNKLCSAIGTTSNLETLRRERSYSGPHPIAVYGTASTPQRSAPLSHVRNSGSFRTVGQYLEVFGAANRPEFRFLDLLIPWIFVVSTFGFLTAWLVVTILERTGLTRHIWHLPLFFLALVVLLSSIIGLVCFP